MPPRIRFGSGLVALAAMLACSQAFARDSEKSPRANVQHLTLQIAPDAFGSAGVDDIEAVVRSAGYELQRYAGDGEISPIHIYRGGPIVLYRRETGGRVVMKLDFDGPYWAQCAFQFGHELCHILCNYRESLFENNKWFEESLCETASLFVLRQMAETWKTAAPYPNWRSYAPHLGEYAAKRMKEARLPEGKTLAEWRKENAAEMEKNPTDRPRNNIVATAILPLFEAEPQHWAAVRHLNDDVPNHIETLQQYLQRWHDHTPAEHQEFVRKVAAEVGVKLTAPAR